MIPSVSSYAANVSVINTGYPKPIKAEVTVACKREPLIQKAQSMENFTFNQSVRNSKDP